MENLNRGDLGTASAASATFIEERQGDKLAEIKAALGGRFEILEVLDASENQTLLLARDDAKRADDSEATNLIRLKVLSRISAVDPKKIELFHLEAFAASRLSHPNIAKTSAPEYVGNIHFCASQHYTGVRSLRDLLDRQGWLAPELAASIAGQITDALEHAWSKGVLHLNLQPKNILVRADGRTIVAGFGITADKEQDWARQERSRRLPAQYLSPEQAQEHHLDYASDLYSLGVLLFEMLTDRVPFDSFDPEVIKRKHVAHTPQAPQVFRAGLSVLQSGLVMALLEKSPDKRCQNMSQLRSVLSSLAGGLANGANNLAATPNREVDLQRSVPSGDDLPSQDETGDTQAPQEARPPAPATPSAEKLTPLRDLPRDPFYEGFYALPLSPVHAGDESHKKSLSSDPTEPRPVELSESKTGDTIVPSDEVVASEPEPERATSREVFEPPTITVIDPPTNAPEDVRAKSSSQLSHPKHYTQEPFALKLESRSRWRWGVLVLISAVVAAMVVILFARGNRPAKVLQQAPAEVPASAPDSASIKPEAGAPAQAQAQINASAAGIDQRVADVKDEKQESTRQTRKWRAQPTVRSASKSTYSPQAGKQAQQPKQKFRSARSRVRKPYRRR